MQTPTKFEYIVKTLGICGGRARIDGHRITVEDIVGRIIFGGASVAQVVEGYTTAGITAAQVHAALAYYYDHQQEIEANLNAGFDLAPDAAGVRAMIAAGKLDAIKWPPEATYRSIWLVKRQSLEELLLIRQKSVMQNKPGRPPNTNRQ